MITAPPCCCPLPPFLRTASQQTDPDQRYKDQSRSRSILLHQLSSSTRLALTHKLISTRNSI